MILLNACSATAGITESCVGLGAADVMNFIWSDLMAGGEVLLHICETVNRFHIPNFWSRHYRGVRDRGTRLRLNC